MPSVLRTASLPKVTGVSPTISPVGSKLSATGSLWFVLKNLTHSIPENYLLKAQDEATLNWSI